MWYRPPTRDLKPEDQYNNALAQAAGATLGGIPTSMMEGYSLAKQGHIERAIEHFVPPAALAAMEGARHRNARRYRYQGRVAPFTRTDGQ